MATGLDIEWRDGEAQSLFRRMRVALAGAKITKALGLRYLEWIGDSFRQEGAERPWQPLKPATKKRRRGGKGGRILQDTGALRASFILGRGGNIFKHDALKVTVGTQTKYAVYHESDKPRKILPQRKMLPTNRLAEILAKTTAEIILEKATK